MLVQATALRKHYVRKNNTVAALDEVDLSLEAGQFVAIQGPSGSGKSTFLLVVAGMLRPDSGTVLLDGTDLYALSSGERAELRSTKLGMVFQQFHLIPYLNVVENVLVPTLGKPSVGDSERARELVDQFGLGERIDHVPADLSTGERQRVALARALLHRPALLLADEPTGNLDESSGRIVLEALRTFTEQGGSVLLVTHDSQAASAADSVMQMDSGKLAHSTSP